MRIVLIMFLGVAFTSTSAQTPYGPLPSSCGPKSVDFNVTLEKSQHSLMQPAEGKARVYFIRDLDPANSRSMMFGIDGAWVGAIRENSYFSVTITPGEHHICAASPYFREEKLVVLAHLQAEAGRMYFYRTRYLELGPIDSDEGKYLIASYPLSVSRPKN